ETNILGTSWVADKTIIFGVRGSGLMRVPEDGGQPEALTTLNQERAQIQHSFPTSLPDGRHFLYVVDSDKTEERAIYMGSLDDKKVVRFADIRHKVNYVEPGYLLFTRGVTLMAQRFELNPPRLTDEAVPVGDNVSMNTAVNSAPFTASLNGTILYRGGGAL